VVELVASRADHAESTDDCPRGRPAAPLGPSRALLELEATAASVYAFLSVCVRVAHACRCAQQLAAERDSDDEQRESRKRPTGKQTTEAPAKRVRAAVPTENRHSKGPRAQEPQTSGLRAMEAAQEEKASKAKSQAKSRSVDALGKKRPSSAAAKEIVKQPETAIAPAQPAVGPLWFEEDLEAEDDGEGRYDEMSPMSLADVQRKHAEAVSKVAGTISGQHLPGTDRVPYVSVCARLFLYAWVCLCLFVCLFALCLHVCMTL
jgi:hypothetical protein